MVKLSPAVTVGGIIVDDQGQPIPDVQVRPSIRYQKRVGDDEQLGIGFSLKTDASGAWTCPTVPASLERLFLVATASGHAIDMRNINIATGIAPVNFQLEPGHVIRVRVLDHNGQPARKARIFFQSWRNTQAYFAFRKVNQYADENGIWEWKDAPADEFTADICPSHGMQLSARPLVAREEEYVFHTSPALLVTGRVVDALTQQPIPKFHILPGVSRSPGDNVFWSAREGFEASQGQFEYKNDDGFSTLQLKVSADGYLPLLSRNITDNEGQIELKFELQRGNDLAPIILAPDGKPVVGAKVALGLEGTQIALKNGEFTSSTYAEIRTTDDDDRVRFPAQSDPYQLIITHPQGYAQVDGAAGDDLKSIQLEAWCQVNGTYMVGQTPGTNLPMAINYYPRSTAEIASLWFQQETSTDREGHFHFERVIPGRGRVGRELVMMVNEGATAVGSSRKEFVEFPAGKTIDIQIGGTGCPVIGRLQVPDGLTPEQAAILWKFTSLFVSPPQPAIASGFQSDPADDDQTSQKKYQEWIETPAGQDWSNRYQAAEAMRQRLPVFRTTIAPDGRFRMEDVPSGTYELRSMMGSPPSSAELRKSSEGIYQTRFTVPEIPTGSSQEPTELGAIKFETNP